MKKIALCASALLACLPPLSAQVTVEVRLDQDQFLPNEALPAAVRITNRSGQTLHLGGEEDWLTFSVESKEALIVRKNGEAPVVGEFALESSKTATKHVDLAPYFALSQQGRYAIVATVKIKDWDHQVVSLPKPFYILEGSRLWEQAFGIPKSAGLTNTPPEVRKYVLQQANYLKGPLRLYFRLTDDAGGKTFRVFPIGQMVSFSRPDPQVDKLSNLHVLYQSGPQSYSYTAFNPDGEIIARQIYDYVGTRPRLQPNEDGTISVMGGVRRLTANDLPASKLETDPNAGSQSQR